MKIHRCKATRYGKTDLDTVLPRSSLFYVLYLISCLRTSLPFFSEITQNRRSLERNRSSSIPGVSSPPAHIRPFIMQSFGRIEKGYFQSSLSTGFIWDPPYRQWDRVRGFVPFLGAFGVRGIGEAKASRKLQQYFTSCSWDLEPSKNIVLAQAVLFHLLSGFERKQKNSIFLLTN